MPFARLAYLLVAFVALIALPMKGALADGHEAAAQDDAIVVTVLGTGTPIPTADQLGPSFLVQAGGRVLLFDCGRGCTSRLAAVDPKLVSEVEHIFLTLMHSDHLVGIPDLFLIGWTQGRNAPLKNWGPPGTAAMFTNMRETFAADIQIRVDKGVPATMDGIAMATTEISEDQLVFDQDGVRVLAFLVDHGPVKPAFGFRVDYGANSVLISGDTGPSENLVRYAEGVDVLLHEVLSPMQVAYIRSKFTEEQALTVIKLHTTAEQAAAIFAEVEPKLAVYYHTRNTVADVAALHEETGRIYKGQLVVAEDLLQIRVDDGITLSMVE